MSDRRDGRSVYYALDPNALEELESYTSPSDMDIGYAHSYARLLRARMAMAHGDAAGALSALGPPQIEPNCGYPNLMNLGLALERWTRAEAYEALGEREVALRWLSTFREPSGSDLTFMGAARQKQAYCTAQLRERGRSVGASHRT